MKYYIHIDESGPFDEAFSGKEASVVGGICSQHSEQGWECLHQDHLNQFCHEYPNVKFSYPKHYHCGPLLAGTITGPEGSAPSLVRKFTTDVFANVLSKATFGFLSRNSGKRFAYSPQATYLNQQVAPPITS
jgi:hypothetical protein